MRVLLLHNRYRALGGEERTVADIVALLRSRGHEVHLLERSSEELEQARVRGARVGRLRAAQALIRGGLDEQEVGDAVRRVGADVGLVADAAGRDRAEQGAERQARVDRAPGCAAGHGAGDGETRVNTEP